MLSIPTCWRPSVDNRMQLNAKRENELHSHVCLSGSETHFVQTFRVLSLRSFLIAQRLKTGGDCFAPSLILVQRQ